MRAAKSVASIAACLWLATAMLDAAAPATAQDTPATARDTPAPELGKGGNDTVLRQIRDLDAPEFLTRETAMLKLLDAGPAILPALRPVLTGGSLEATSRALFIVRQVGLTADLDGQDQAGQLLAELAERKEAPALARRAADALAELTQQRSAQALAELEQLGAKVGRSADEPALSIEIGEAYRGDENDLRRLKWIIDIPIIMLSGKQVTDGWVKHALAMPTIEELHIYQAGISDAALASLSEQSTLKQLGIYYTPVDHAVLTPLLKAPLLGFIKLYGTQVDKAEVDKFREASGIAIDHRRGAFLGVQGADAGEICPISHVHPGSPAEKAGLLPDDIIVRFGKDRATNFSGLTELISRCNAGDEVEIEVVRRDANEKVKVTATLSAWELRTAVRNSRPR